MLAASEEDYVVTGLLQPRAEVAAHAARTHRGDSHTIYRGFNRSLVAVVVGLYGPSLGRPM